jgi:pyoverdine/dityrosine biosynthesis protein Dit1
MYNISIMKQMREQPETEAVGTAWTLAEEQKLIKSLKDGMTMDEIAKDHKRTVNDIKTRIKLLAFNMIENGDAIGDICDMFRLDKDELVYNYHKAKVKTDKKSTETEMDILIDIRKILLSIQEKLLE